VTATDLPGGMGEASPESRKWENRRHLTIIQQAVYQGWDLPPDASAAIPATLRAIMDDPVASTRDRIRASECLAALRKDRVEAAIQLDRIGRLDAGTATDRVELLSSISDAALGAVAQSLRPAPKPAPEPPLLPSKPAVKRKARKGKP